MKFHNYAWRTFADNGWEWDQKKSFEAEDYDVYKMTFLMTYKVTIYTCISMSSNHLCLDGHYGVLWLESEYEYDRSHSIGELTEMRDAIEAAENNLLLIGIPFTPDYKFLGKNKANKKRRNDALRRKLNLDEQEKANDD